MTFSRLPASWLAASLCVSAAATGAGVYDTVAIDEDEQRLIEEAKDLEGYFNAQTLLYKEPRALELVRRVGHEIGRSRRTTTSSTSSS